MKILCIFAHLDDAEIWAGGTIAQHSRHGDQVESFVFTKPSDPRIPESKSAHSILGSQISTEDGDIYSDAERLVERLTRRIHDFTPDILITHWYEDAHPDHRRIFELSNRAVIEPWIKSSRPSLFLMTDTYSSQGIKSPFRPSHYIDITPVWNTKMKALAQFKSQPYLMWQQMINKQNSLFGDRVMRQYAEGFSQFPIQGKYSALELLIL